jgi:hypothetical protein
MGKLKTHSECGATLSTKNLFGLPPVGPYIVPAMEGWRPRYKLHDRGVSQAIVDICLARPIHYAVIDGGVGMEGDGPTDGLPRLCDLVIAGANHVAVDRTALQIMGIPQHKCQHLDYAYLRGLGPYSLDAGQVQIVGDSLPAMSPFLYPTGVPPRIWYPVGTPNPLPKGQMATIRFRLTDPAETKVEIVTVSDESPAITVLRTISDWSFTNSGLVQTSWDCRDANGALVPTPTAPTSYGIRVQARHPGMTRVSRMINWLPVMP